MSDISFKDFRVRLTGLEADKILFGIEGYKGKESPDDPEDKLEFEEWTIEMKCYGLNILAEVW
jgi:hypothetical protein